MRVLTTILLLGFLCNANAQEPLSIRDIAIGDLCTHGPGCVRFVKPIYFGFSVGTMAYKEDLTVLNDPESRGVDLASFDDSMTTWKVYGGYRFNDHFGLEGSYMKADDAAGSASGNNAIDGDYTVGATADFRSYSLKAMGYLPTSWGNLFAGIGGYEGRSDLSFSASFDAFDPETIRSSDGFAGLTGNIGAQWHLDSVILRAEYEYSDFSEGSASALNLGAVWEF
jgi:OOP family OmpA-OmpF porin